MNRRRFAMLRRPICQLPRDVLHDLAGMPCLCAVLPTDRRPCTSCRARAVTHRRTASLVTAQRIA